MPACLGLPEEHLDLAATPTSDQPAAKVRKMKRGKAPDRALMAFLPRFSKQVPCGSPYNENCTSCA
jgi:hypothetical protein